VTSVDAD
jgi:glutamate dehydrogenase (NAD(P)+)